MTISDLPYVSLIRGNLSDSLKLELVNKVIETYKILPEDILKIEYLNTDSVKDIQSFCARVPFGKLKLVSIDMKDVSERNQNSILKILETPPECVKFILFTEINLLETVESRSLIFDMQCSTSSFSLEDKNLVLEALNACKHKDSDKLDSVLKSWTEGAHKLLLKWALEARSGKFEIFSFEETLGLGLSENLPDSLIVALSVLDNARPKIVVKSILSSIVET